jgi:dTMP kinase
MLIALCGIDGAGKTSQVKRLYDYFNENNKKVICCKQHTDEYYASSKLNNFLYKENRTIESTVEMAYIASMDRLKQYENVILPNLYVYDVVIVDRYVFSTYAYYIARGMEISDLLKMNSKLPLPDLTFYLDVTSEEAQKRITGRKILTQEEMNINFLKKVRDNYIRQQWGENKSYYIINGMESPQIVMNNILNIINEVE